MRNKETCIRLIEKLEGKLQTLLFLLSRPNADIKEFRDVIIDFKEEMDYNCYNIVDNSEGYGIHRILIKGLMTKDKLIFHK